MARNVLTLTTSAALALSGGVAKTVLQLVAPTNTIVAVTGISLTFDGASATAVPVVVKVLRQTSAGTMTARTPLSTTDRATAIQTTGQENATAEPVAGNLLHIFHLHPQTGSIIPLQIQREIEVAGGGRLGVQCNAPAGVNCLATMTAEE